MIKGQTGLILQVPEAEPVIAPIRDRYDRNTAPGVPPHVTVLFPWIPINEITDEDYTALRELAAETLPLRFTLSQVGEFPELLWLAPQPDDAVRALTMSVVARWPSQPPYRGQFADVIPHLTVADGIHADEFAQARAALEHRLPMSATIQELSLFTAEDHHWRCAETFEFGGHSGA